MDLSNLQTLLPQSANVLPSDQNDGNLVNEKSRSVKICYTSYKLIVTFFMICAIIIYLFVRDLNEAQSFLNILHELAKVSANSTSQIG